MSAIAENSNSVYLGTYTSPAFISHVVWSPDCADAVGGTLADGASRNVYSANTHCSVSCSPVAGSVTCSAGVLTGDTTFAYSSCTPSATDTCGTGNGGGDPHFTGFRGQKVRKKSQKKC